MWVTCRSVANSWNPWVVAVVTWMQFSQQFDGLSAITASIQHHRDFSERPSLLWDSSWRTSMHLSHVQQAQDSRAHENYGEAHGLDWQFHWWPCWVDESAGNDDACGRYGGNRCAPGDDEQHGPGEEEAREGTWISAPRQTPLDVRQIGTNEIKVQQWAAFPWWLAKLKIPWCHVKSRIRSTWEQPAPFNKLFQWTSTGQVLRPEAHQVHLPEARGQLHWGSFTSARKNLRAPSSATFSNGFRRQRARSTRAQGSKLQPNMPKKSVIPYTSTNCPHAKSQRRSISAQLKEKCETATRDRILHNDHIKNANISGRTGAAMSTSRWRCARSAAIRMSNVLKYKDNTVTRQWVDVTNYYKPSGRPRAVSPWVSRLVKENISWVSSKEVLTNWNKKKQKRMTILKSFLNMKTVKAFWWNCSIWNWLEKFSVLIDLFPEHPSLAFSLDKPSIFDWVISSFVRSSVGSALNMMSLIHMAWLLSLLLAQCFHCFSILVSASPKESCN